VSRPPLEFETLLRKNGLVLDVSRLELMSAYVELLLEWNKKINLVSRRDTDSIWTAHIMHCLGPLFALEIPDGIRLLDLGSGGGLPGIPLAIVHGGLRVTLLDSIQKKTRAVESMIQTLGLKSLDVCSLRAEEAGRVDKLAGSFDAVVARAVASLPHLVQWSRPFLRKRDVPASKRRYASVGAKSEFSFPYLLALKGGNLEREKRDVLMRGRSPTITEIELIFRGSEALPLVDKKLIIAEFH
jgi:16S rRNA (guanine527-N7)-methyltransferase